MRAPWDRVDLRNLLLLVGLTVSVRLIFVSGYGVSGEEGDHAVHVASHWAGVLGPDQGEEIAKAKAYLSHRRTQLLYPALLLPMAWLQIPQKTYLFFLQHGIFASLMVAGGYGVAREWKGRGAALAAGVALALYLPVMRTASWPIHDTLFYACLLLFFFGWALALRMSRQAWLIWGVAALGLLATRPEGWMVLLVAMAVLLFRFLGSRWNLATAIGAFMLTAVLTIGTLAAAWSGSETFRKTVFEQVACSFHVSWALFLSTHTVFNDAGREGQREMQRVMDSLPPGVSANEVFAREGLAFIAAHPWRYAGMAVARATAILFPAPFRPSWATWRRVYDAVISTAVLFGVGLAWRHERSYPLLDPMLLAAGGMAAFITFWGIGGDARHQNAIYVILIPLAAVGFSACLPAKEKSAFSI